MRLSIILLVLMVVIAVAAGWGDRDHSESGSSSSGSKSSKSSGSKRSKSDESSESKSSKSSGSKSSKSSGSKSSKSSKSKSSKSSDSKSSKSSDSKSSKSSDSKSSKSSKSEQKHEDRTTEKVPEKESVTIDCPPNHDLQCWNCNAPDHSKCRAMGKWQTCDRRQTCFLEEYRDKYGKQYVTRGCKNPSVCRKSDYLYPHCLRTLKVFKCATCGPRCGYKCVKREPDCPVKCRKCRCSTERECRKLKTFEKCEGYSDPVCEEKTITSYGKTYFLSGCSERRDCPAKHHCYYDKKHTSKTCVKCTKPIEIDCKPKPTTPKPTKPTTPKPTTPKPTTRKPTTPKPTTPKPTTPKPTTPKPTTPEPKCPEEVNTVLNFANRNEMTVTITGPRLDELEPFHNFLQGSRKQLMFVINNDVANRVRIDFDEPQNIAGISAESKFSDFLEATLYRGNMKVNKEFKTTSDSSGKFKEVNIEVSPTEKGITRVDFDFGYGNGNEIRVKAGFITTCP